MLITGVGVSVCSVRTTVQDVCVMYICKYGNDKRSLHPSRGLLHGIASRMQYSVTIVCLTIYMSLRTQRSPVGGV